MKNLGGNRRLYTAKFVLGTTSIRVEEMQVTKFENTLDIQRYFLKFIACSGGALCIEFSQP